MANTYQKITTVTVGSGGASSIDFTSIPQTYTDLKIVLSARTTQGNIYGGGAMQFNGDTGSNYKWYRFYGNGATGVQDNSASATAITNWDMVGASSTASVFSNIEFYIPSYTSANHKNTSIEYVGENNATTAYLGFVVGLWSNTGAITSIKIYSGGGNIVEFSSATLYGIKSS